MLNHGVLPVGLHPEPSENHVCFGRGTCLSQEREKKWLPKFSGGKRVLARD